MNQAITSRDILLVSPRTLVRFTAASVVLAALFVVGARLDQEWLIDVSLLGMAITLPVIIKTGLHLTYRRFSRPLNAVAAAFGFVLEWIASLAKVAGIFGLALVGLGITAIVVLGIIGLLVFGLRQL